jgi:hypothetical protein
MQTLIIFFFLLHFTKNKFFFLNALKKKSSQKKWDCYEYMEKQDFSKIGGRNKKDAAGALCKITRLRKAVLQQIARDVHADDSGTIPQLCASISRQINTQKLDAVQIYKKYVP